MASGFSALLETAKKGGKDLKKEEKPPAPTNAPAAPVPAELLANLGNILNDIQQTQRAPDRPAPGPLHPATVPIDINGSPNPSGEPVLYKPRTSYVTRVPGVPYAVSDVDHTCQICKPGRPCNRHDRVEKSCGRCVRATPCKRHTRPEVEHTSVSLCDQNHGRMRVYWNLAHIDDSSAILGLNISSSKDDKGNKLECPHGDKMCKVYNVDERIKLLVSRMIEDYNIAQDKIQDKKKNRPYVDARNRTYTEYAGPRRWGPNQPSIPTKGTGTRSSHKYASTDGSRLEREIRILVRAWRSKKGEPKTEGRQRKYMDHVWENKMAALKAAKGMKDNGKKMPVVRMGLNGGILVSGTEKAGNGDENAPVRKERGTKETKKSIQKRPLSKPVVGDSDEEEEEEVKPIRKTKTTKKPTPKRKAVDESDGEVAMPPKKAKTHVSVPKDSDASKPTELPTSAIAFPKNTEAELSIFEQLLDDVTETESGTARKPKEVARASEVKQATQQPRATATPRAPTAEESELLQRMKQAAEEESQSEEEDEVIADEPQDEEQDEVIDEEADDEEGVDVPEPEPERPKASEQTTTPSAPSPEPASTKRKTPPSAATQPASKKSKYKSTATITDSDDEADYILPAAPALELPEQNEGWELTEAVSESILKVVQTDQISTAIGDVVVEQGTTIVKKIEENVETYKSPFVESGSDSEGGLSKPVERIEEVEKRKWPFVESEDEAEAERPVKKVKRVTFEEPVEESVLEPVEEPAEKSFEELCEEEFQESAEESVNGEIEIGGSQEGEVEEEETRDYEEIDGLFNE